MRVILSFLLLTGCGPVLAHQLREQRDTRTLSDAAVEYWLMVRWNDPGRAAAYLATPEQKLKLAHLLGEPSVRITDAAVIQVVVSDELPEDRLPIKREGTAVVRIEGYDVRLGRVQVQTVEQHWLKAQQSWKVDAERSPLGVDHPW
jgi:hypothetical protein